MKDMSDINSEFVKEIAKKIPIDALYTDAVSPSAIQVGQVLSDIIKTMQLALAPVQFASALQDRLREFIDQSVRRVPEEKRQSPAPQILGPVIEGIRYEPEGTPIDQMFSELLSRSIDRSRAHEAHPAYPIIIKQLSSDEANIIKKLRNTFFVRVDTLKLDSNKNIFFGQPTVERDNFPKEILVYPENVIFYFNHLYNLGLAGLFQQGNQEPIFGEHPRRQIGVRRRFHYTLTDFGLDFVNACTDYTQGPV